MAPDTDSPKNEHSDMALRWSGRVSLTWRILAINIFALALLAGGFFYLDSYRTRIVDARLDQSQRELRLLAIALESTPPAQHNALISAFAKQGDDRIRRYAPDGRLVTDSFRLGAFRYELRDPAEEAWKRHIARFLDKVVDGIVSADRPPNFIEPKIDRAEAWPEIVAARRTGQDQTANRYAPDRTSVISAAAVMQDGSTLLATENARDITKTVRAERLRLGLVLAAAILASVLLSLFLARTIVLPLRRLAMAAVRVRLGRAREVTVPRLPDRRDEIGMLARALSDMSHGLRNRIDATDAFAADVSHELKNPIASLRSALDGLESVEKPELRAQLLGIAKDDVRRLDRLVTDIAEASRVDAQLSRTRFEQVDLGPLIENLVVAREARGVERKVRLAFARPRKDVAVVMGEPQRLSRVIENLLDNAISFSPDGGLVQIVATVADQEVLVSMEDEGPGVPPQERETVFRRFHSVRPEGQFGKHSGLGLAIARSIVEGHQGRVSIGDRDDEQSGARFIVRLPMAQIRDPGITPD
ncbi:sensor N-terminal transmembrane domain-containing protein [Sphingobium phenoxybenzoativorans]|uniref:histidine kinase n=1 Tax=Sphingobium phenoxybenzoativorans TaxID=1592790 RepID=A0A975Q3E5_9SPHN|nr:ATP-binding protein [Sphingobium phenoxybenzoativorans]QUT07437.1 sensor N-terminal transmembrane domain-containing protein [Sphingobium phenoxybenzoativorans]